MYQVISYYPSKDEVIVKNYSNVANALKEYDSVVEDFCGMYDKNITSVDNSLSENSIAETRFLVDDYYANAYTCVKKIELLDVK